MEYYPPFLHCWACSPKEKWSQRMKKIFTYSAVFAALFSMSGLDAQNGIFSPSGKKSSHHSLDFEYVTLCKDYSCYNNYLYSVEGGLDGEGIPVVTLNNGSQWELMLEEGADPMMAYTMFKCWEKCDWIVLSPPKCPGDHHFYLRNMSRGGHEIAFRMIGGPIGAPEFMELLAINQTMPLPNGGMQVMLSDGSEWIFSKHDTEMIEGWFPGDPVMIDVVQEFDFHSSTLLIRERAMMVNISHLDFALAK